MAAWQAPTFCLAAPPTRPQTDFSEPLGNTCWTEPFCTLTFTLAAMSTVMKV
jgi:hypothetical protein